MKQIKPRAAEIDLHEYDNPIKSADGTVPYNGYLWPTESWWPGHEKQFRNSISGQWNFGVVALIDGRFSVDGTVSKIKHNTDNPYPSTGDPEGRPVVFPTREIAIRISAARMIRDIRASRYWGNAGGSLSRETMEAVINWSRKIVAKECSAPKLLKLVSLPPPPPVPTGLELIDYINKRDYAQRLQPNH